MPRMATTPDAAQELRTIRHHLGLTQKELARRMGVHKLTVAQWEASTPPPPLLALYLARFLVEVSPIAPPPFARPAAEELGIYVQPGGRCLWQHSDSAHCAGPWYAMQAPVYHKKYVYTEACEGHVWQAYEGLVQQIRAGEERRMARAQRTAKRHAKQQDAARAT
jgi:transcriptional regulator with XRE-family HTH domain